MKRILICLMNNDPYFAVEIPENATREQIQDFRQRVREKMPKRDPDTNATLECRIPEMHVDECSSLESFTIPEW